LTMLYRSTDCLSRRSAAVTRVSHSASFASCDKDALSNPGIYPAHREHRYADATRNDSAEELLAGLSGENLIKQPDRHYVLEQIPNDNCAAAQLQPCYHGSYCGARR
jgi:hypothetical protein